MGQIATNILPQKLSDVLSFDSWLPGGPVVISRTRQAAPGAGVSLSAVLLGIVFFLIGAAIAVGIDVLFAFLFTWITVTFFDASLESIRIIFPMAAVGFAAVLSLGMIFGAFQRNVLFGVIILSLRVFALYVA
ncbi:MAG: hypothetical protein AAF986_09890, partial [Pseudomonadota bacterium]